VAKRNATPRARTRARALARAADKLARNRERLAALEPGGAPSRAIEVESASQVEPHALRMTCLRCGAPNRLDEHAAVTHEGEALRVAELSCPRCGAQRRLWFRIAPTLPS